MKMLPLLKYPERKRQSMGLLNNILEKDLHNCYDSIKADKVLTEIEQQFYEFLKDADKSYLLAMEKIFTTYVSQSMRIAYIQGLKDFNELFIDLKADAADILTKHIQSL